MRQDRERAAAEISALYAACYPRLVGALTLTTGSRTDAEECVQEAFVRLLGHWSTVRSYDQPEAWVRKVAFRSALNRRRRILTEAKAILRLGVLETPDDGPDVQAAQRLLAPLSTNHRQVVVLHHLMGLEVADIAETLGIPVGTVKSRLSRARAVMSRVQEWEASHG